MYFPFLEIEITKLDVYTVIMLIIVCFLIRRAKGQHDNLIARLNIAEYDVEKISE